MSVLLALKNGSIPDFLHALYPSEGVIYIGPASVPTTQLLIDLVHERVTIIDGDGDRCKTIGEKFAQNAHTEFRSQVLYNEATELPYYRTSLRSEGGVISPTKLCAFWQNIVVMEQFQVKTATLTQEQSLITPEADWLLIDDLHGQEILDGAKPVLDQFTVILIRCCDDQIEPEPHAPREDPDVSEISQLRSFLEHQGFLHVQQIRTRHPLLPVHCFVRDWKSVGQTLRSDLDRLTSNAVADRDAADQRIAELEKALTDLERTRKETAIEQRAQNDQAASSIAALTSEKAELNSQYERLQSQFLEREQSLLTENADIRESILALKEQLIDNDRKYGDRLEVTERSIAELEQQNGDLRKELSVALKLKEDSDKTCNELQAKSEHLQHTLNEQTETIDAIQVELNAKSQQVASQESAVREAESRQMLAEHNLTDLQIRYKTLSKLSKKQSDDLDKIASHLKAAKQQLISDGDHDSSE